ncbi:MAG: hypothetical protein HY735_25890 [Verrucomicrobia bacterium]|nr:hypothetical protein [Verrucomicrobiota bacterium]
MKTNRAAMWAFLVGIGSGCAFHYSDKDGTEHLETNLTDDRKGYWIQMPSFLATVDSDIQAASKEASVGVIQYFATGEAATDLTRHAGVRQAMASRLDPRSATAEKLKNLQADLATVEQQASDETNQISDKEKLKQAILAARDLQINLSAEEANKLVNLADKNLNDAKKQLIVRLKAGDSQDVKKLRDYVTRLKQLR